MVFKQFHDSPVVGYQGIVKTISNIRKEFIWKGMDREIAVSVRACHLCSLSKPVQNTKMGVAVMPINGEIVHRLRGACPT